MKAGQDPDVLVIGAGVAGLTAARDLSQAGLRVAVLEARDRIGGRIHTLHDPSWTLPVELGAEFVHGLAEDTMRIVRAAGLSADRLPDDHYYVRGGKLSSSRDFWATVQKVGKDIARRLARAKADFSLDDYLARAHLPSDVKQMIVDFVEGYHAAHTDLISARVLAESDGETEEEPGGDDRQSRITAGYDRVPRWLRAGLDPARVQVRLNTVVHELAWKRGEVSAHCTTATGASKGSFTARAAVVAVPHAILKAKALRFRPSLPAKERAIGKLEVGQVVRIVLRFREAFWEEKGFIRRRLAEKRREPAELNFVHDHQAEVPTWWTALPAHLSRITGWAGGPRAEALLDRDPSARVERSLDALAHVLRVPRRLLDDQLEASVMHDWRADPFSLGAYTYASVGGQSAQKALAKSVQGTLFFAGEATSVDETGTVSGAIATGHRAAREVLKYHL